MTQNSYNGQIVKPWTPGIYRIEVMGEVDEIFSDRLAGMRITTRSGKDKTTVTTVTTLTGRLVDQAELAGVLNNLYEMHFPILLVEKSTDS